MIEKLYGNIPSYGKSYFTERVDEIGSSVVKNLFKRIILSKRGGINGLCNSKLVYDNKRIRYRGNTYFCDDDADMEILCNSINALLTENAIKIHKMEMQLSLIEQAVDIGKGDLE